MEPHLSREADVTQKIRVNAKGASDSEARHRAAPGGGRPRGRPSPKAGPWQGLAGTAWVEGLCVREEAKMGGHLAGRQESELESRSLLAMGEGAALTPGHWGATASLSRRRDRLSCVPSHSHYRAKVLIRAKPLFCSFLGTGREGLKGTRKSNSGKCVRLRTGSDSGDGWSPGCRGRGRQQRFVCTARPEFTGCQPGDAWGGFRRVRRGRLPDPRVPEGGDQHLQRGRPPHLPPRYSSRSQLSWGPRSQQTW